MKDLPPGEYRRMYFDRFGRDELMILLKLNCAYTQSEKYLQQFERISLL